MSNREVIKKIISGYTMTPPDNCNEKLKELMIIWVVKLYLRIYESKFTKQVSNFVVVIIRK